MTNESSGMFEAMYAGAEAGGAKPPWDCGAPRPQLVEWAEARNVAIGGSAALVVGCGYGGVAEFLASRGFRTTGFDFAPTAIAGGRRRYPASEVDYVVADVLDLPGEWQGMFDLVVESLTVQSMPPEQHSVAARNIAALVASGGTLLVLATTREEHSELTGPPWPLTRAEVEVFAEGDLVMRRLERIESGASDATASLFPPVVQLLLWPQRVQPRMDRRGASPTRGGKTQPQTPWSIRAIGYGIRYDAGRSCAS